MNVVEFTPGRWSRSVSLANAAHWNWTGTDFLSFDVAVPSPHHADFESEQMFHEACTRIADAARRAALALDARFPDFQAAADFVIAEAQSSPDRMGPSWWGYKAAIAAALTGRPEQAAWFFDRLTDPRVTVRARNLRPLLAQPEAFRQAIQAFVGQERQRLMLPPLDTSPF
ncbi:hypothetical protein [Sphingomonas sp. PB1R3]|uniref:hypothetical protein n=1 Tax=Sphingomonas flavida TaxID=3096154 RepID=UPI002FC6527D